MNSPLDFGRFGCRIGAGLTMRASGRGWRRFRPGTPPCRICPPASLRSSSPSHRFLPNARGCTRKSRRSVPSWPRDAARWRACRGSPAMRETGTSPTAIASRAVLPGALETVRTACSDIWRKLSHRAARSSSAWTTRSSGAGTPGSRCAASTMTRCAHCAASSSRRVVCAGSACCQYFHTSARRPDHRKALSRLPAARAHALCNAARKGQNRAQLLRATAMKFRIRFEVLPFR